MAIRTRLLAELILLTFEQDGAAAAHAQFDGIERRFGRRKLDEALEELAVILESQMPDGTRFADAVVLN